MTGKLDTQTARVARARSRISPWWWVLSAAGAVVAIIAVVAWFGGQTAPDGDAYFADPDKIVLAIIGAIVALGAPAVPTLRNISRDTAATQHHVVNDHGDKVLRDDMDEMLRLLRAQETRMVRMEGIQETQGRDIFELRQEIGQIRSAERDQWDAIEQSAGRRRRQREVDHD